MNDVTICIGFNIPALKDEAIHMRNLSYQELLSPPAGGRGKKVRGALFSSLPALREQVGQEFHCNKSYESFCKIESGSHRTTPKIKMGSRYALL
ncbi:MAG: hypothetical protein H8E82_05720 [Candidatus Marinimicrobia bacterium]|nr:hypothetical protein [Candidatus Neomarinimicrobiota bacterium]